MSADLVIRDGEVVSPAGRERCDLVIEDGRIAARVPSGTGDAAEIVEASGLAVLPGGVDPHVHMMDPGLTEKEDFPTGTAAAAVGGVTTIVEHHRSLPFVLDATVLTEKAAYLSTRSRIDFALFGGGHPDNVEELLPMWKAGAAVFKVFTCNLHGVPAVLPGRMLTLFREVAAFDGLCLIHAEDEFVTAENEERLKAAGRKDPRVIPEWRSKEAEQVAVNTVALLARLSGCRVIIAHASHPHVCDLVGRERSLGARLMVESCPQYFHLTEDEIDEWGPFHKFTPPARTAADRDGMWERLEAGDIDMVCADHAPSTREQKEVGRDDIWAAPFGVPGVETNLSMMLTGVSEGKLSLERLVAARSESPAKAYGLYPRKGHLGVGADADIALVDLGAERTIRDDDVVAKVGWTPFAGRKVRGRVTRTYVRGRLVAEDGAAIVDPGWGVFLPGPGYEGSRS
ncbi:MAG: amidohydrolase family protein [Actinobacteria bacterium]|nr:amidohydrolase family protein [Actinomycetota bacterium]